MTITQVIDIIEKITDDHNKAIKALRNKRREIIKGKSVIRFDKNGRAYLVKDGKVFRNHPLVKLFNSHATAGG